MPFRINYSGPAPISTFFRPREADTLQAIAEKATEVPDTALITSVSPKLNSGKRFISAFRGRVVQGLEIVLPHGYKGLVLRNELPSKVSRPVRKDRKKTRSTRRKMECEDQEDEDGTEQASETETSEAVRELVPSHTFESFILWNPDRHVDEGQDEYIRTLKEWTALAAEVCCVITEIEDHHVIEHLGLFTAARL